MKTFITISCIIAFAITTNAQSSGDFRSIKTGNWNDKTIWQTYNGSAWVAATAYPTNTNGKITITDTTSITVNLNLTIDQTVVKAGGQLNLNSNYTITLNNGAGDDLTIDGMLYMTNGTIASPGNLVINGSFLWNGGSLQVATNNGGTINIEGNVYLYSVLTNAGNINWSSTYITFEGGTINNNGIVNALTQNYLYDGNGGTFNNNATGIYNQLGNDGTISRITFNNKGTMNFNAGVFNVDQGVFKNTKTLNFDGGNFLNEATTNLNGGTKITGKGSITQAYNFLNINLTLTLPEDIEFIITNGSIAGSGSLTTKGIITWNDGSINLALTIQNTSVVNIGYNEATLYSTLTNNGTINWLSGYITFEGGSIINNKTFNAYGNGYFYNGNGGTFTNSSGGVFNRLVGTGNLSNQITFNNAGTMNINSGKFFNINSATFTNTGVLNLNNGNFENQATANFNSGSTVTGKGKIINSYNTMNINTSLTLPSNVSFVLTYSSGATIAGTGSLKINGEMFWQNGDINLPVTILSNGLLQISGASGLYSTLTNNGTVNWLSSDIYFYGGTIENNATFNILADYRLYKYTTGSFVNNPKGKIVKNTLGTTLATVTVNNKGAISGTGKFDFGTGLSNSGVFAPGIDTATSILTTGTDYKNKTLLIKMNGTSPGISYDRLQVNGNVKFGSDTLRVTTTGTIPAGSYTIVKFTGTRTGTIKVKDLPANCSIQYIANKVVLKVSSPFSNDDNDRVADNAKIEVNNTQFSIFPNPATNSININFPSKNKSATLQVFDIHGKQVIQKIVTPSVANKIDISMLASGSYMVQISDGTDKKSAKFVKQ
ncbi:MAG: T9SS type A sorting domain-containing protein [Bacteroidetes bacterium]|nr:T9SS type A sorting domain-containing protein [Bacteroidota bacterium]